MTREEYLKQYHTELYHIKRNAGVCVHCKEPALIDSIFCEVHRTKHRQHARDWQRRNK